MCEIDNICITILLKSENILPNAKPPNSAYTIFSLAAYKPSFERIYKTMVTYIEPAISNNTLQII